MNAHFSIGTVLVLALSLSCSRSPDPQVVGTWTSVQWTNQLEFRPDGTFDLRRADGRLISGTFGFIEENRLAVTNKETKGIADWHVTFSGDRMTVVSHTNVSTWIKAKQ